MGVIADLVVNVKADFKEFDKALRGKKTKSAGSGEGSGGLSGSLTGSSEGGAGTDEVVDVGLDAISGKAGATLGGMIGAALGGAAGAAIGSAIGGAIGSIFTTELPALIMGAVVGGMLISITSLIAPILTPIAAAVGFIAGYFGGKFLLEQIKKGIDDSQAVKLLKEFTTGGLSSAFDLMAFGLFKLVEIFGNVLPEPVVEFLKDPLSGMKNIFEGMWDFFIETEPNYDWIKDMFDDAWEDFVEDVTGLEVPIGFTINGVKPEDSWIFNPVGQIEKNWEDFWARSSDSPWTLTFQPKITPIPIGDLFKIDDTERDYVGWLIDNVLNASLPKVKLDFDLNFKKIDELANEIIDGVEDWFRKKTGISINLN